ncbi:hypothetical protein DTW90_09740 [Neorhizobium sp. P12A]|jgi:hypothetical protein|nr:hypothetical protein DTW90_09740 [Neorhizobium sp. P12A]TCR91262.1 hypothetical protein EV561_103660 [Rhizobium sp. BK376]
MRGCGEVPPDLGNILFKIAKANLATPFLSGLPEAQTSEYDLLSQFCVSEGWVGDLANGVIRLGSWSAVMHGLTSSECGLLSLMRCYEAHDRAHILELFEQAATSSSSFCFSTTVLAASGHRQPVFCIGESIGTEEKYTGSMVGVFMFPRFKLEPGSQLSARQ